METLISYVLHLQKIVPSCIVMPLLLLLTLKCLSHLRNGNNEIMLILVCYPFRRLFQAALSGMSCEYVAAGDVDKAFPPGQGIPDSFQRCPLSYMLLSCCNSALHQYLASHSVDARRCSLFFSFSFLFCAAS